MAQGYYYGKYEYALDEKNRIRLPSFFKEDLGENIKIGEGSGKFLVLYSETDFQRVVDRTKAELIENPSRKSEMLRRDVFGGIMELKKDPQSRYLIPAELVAYAELKGPIVVVGNMDQVEIWSKDNFEKRHLNSVAYSKEDKIEMLQMEARVEKEVEMEYRAEMVRKKTLERLKKEFGEKDD